MKDRTRRQIAGADEQTLERLARETTDEEVRKEAEDEQARRDQGTGS